MPSGNQPAAPTETGLARVPPRLGTDMVSSATGARGFADAGPAWFPSWSYRWWGLLIAGLLMPAVLILFWLDPGSYPIYPVCYFHRVTGWLCPACGSLRALHQLLHGHWAMAWRFNPLLVTLLPVAGFMTTWAVARRDRSGSRAIAVRPVWLWLLLVIALAFGVWRNLPGSPPLP